MAPDPEREQLAITLADLSARPDACLACGAPGAACSDPVLARGVDLRALDDALPAWPLCARCQAEEKRALASSRRWQRAFGAVPPLVGLAAGAWVPLAAPLGLAIGVLSGAVLAYVLLRTTGRAFARRLPLVVVRAASDGVEVLRAAPASIDEGSPYRRPAMARGRRGRRAAVGGGGWALAVATCASAFIAWLMTSYLYPRVLLDNARALDVTVDIDGERTLEVRAGASRELRLRHGEHRFRIRYDDETEPETLALALPAGEPHVLALDGERCFEVTSTHETRPHRWADYTQTSTFVSSRSGRWVPIGSGTTVTRADCPGIVFPPFR